MVEVELGRRLSWVNTAGVVGFGALMAVKGMGQSSTATDDLDIVFVFMRNLSVQRGRLLCAVSYANLSVLRILLL